MRRGPRAETAPAPARLWPGLREETSERRGVRAWCLRLRTPRPCRRHQVFAGSGSARAGFRFLQDHNFGDSQAEDRRYICRRMKIADLEDRVTGTPQVVRGYKAVFVLGLLSQRRSAAPPKIY